MRTFLTITALASLSLASPASAQRLWPTLTCPDSSVWHGLDEQQIAKRALAARVVAMSKHMRFVLKDMEETDVEVIVTDCPVDGYATGTSKHETRTAGTHPLTSTLYKFRVAAPFLASRTMDELVLVAQKYGCVLRDNAINAAPLPPVIPDNPSIRRCIYDTALATGHTKYAEGRARLSDLGLGLPKKQPDAPAAQKRVPKGTPPPQKPKPDPLRPDVGETFVIRFLERPRPQARGAAGVFMLCKARPIQPMRPHRLGGVLEIDT